jgi:hypothetical protein
MKFIKTEVNTHSEIVKHVKHFLCLAFVGIYWVTSLFNSQCVLLYLGLIWMLFIEVLRLKLSHQVNVLHVIIFVKSSHFSLNPCFVTCHIKRIKKHQHDTDILTTFSFSKPEIYCFSFWYRTNILQQLKWSS